MRYNNCNSRKNTVNLDQFFTDVFDGIEGVFGRDMNPMNSSIPLTNILEDDNNFKLELAAAGWSKSDFKIHLEKNMLTISTKDDSKGTADLEGNYKRREFRNNALKRSFTLPENVDTENISARYLNGVLTVSIPKLEKEEIIKEVKIS